jgi:G3E family GTPase
MEARTPITIVTGSLGSGKTTLLRRILETTGRRLAILMNEFGEIAIDSRIIAGKNVEMIELAGGCVCCSLTGELEAAVLEIINEVHPELIVLEATGVAEADALVYEVEDNIPMVRLDGVVTIVDAYVSIKFPQMGYTTRTQVESADIILVNKVDLVSAEELAQVEEQVRRYNSRATFFRSVRCEMDTALLFGLGIEKREMFAVPQHSGEFQSFVFTCSKTISRERFAEFVDRLPEDVYRAKGFVCFADGPALFNYVAGRAELEEFAADKTELVFIGRGLSETRETLLQGLAGCVEQDAALLP